MSFAEDLESIQQQIEDLDDASSQKASASSETASMSSGESRIRELEEKAQKLTKMIKRRVEILSPENQHHVSPSVIKKVRSRDENTKLRKKLSNLENEIQELTQKEINWLSTTKSVQSEVKSLRNQINKLKQQNRARSREQKTTTKSMGNKSFFKATPNRKQKRYQQQHQQSESNEMNGDGTEMNIHQFQRLQRVNQQLLRDNQNLKGNITKISNKSLAEIQHLKVRLTEKETEITNLKQQLSNHEYALRDEQHRITDLQQQSLVLQQAVEHYDQLKEEDNKLQLEYQRSLQNVLQARKDKSLIEQQVNSLKNQQQEMEINCRQLNHEKMGALSEMRAMKKVFEQERKNVAERYERIVQKLEAEMAYTQQMYQELKETHRNLQRRFEHDQPQYERLKHDLDAERDVFQHKLNDVVVSHVSNLNMISKASDNAAQNAKWVHQSASEQRTIDERADAFVNLRDKEKEIWEPST